MNTYFSTQNTRPTPYIADGLRRYSASDNPQYIIEGPASKQTGEKVELTSDIQKTLQQAKEEMALDKKPAVRKPAVKRKRQAPQTNKRRKATSRKGGYKKTNTKKKTPLAKKRTSKKHLSVFSIKNGGKKR
jgi:hypothetical protein